MRFVCLMYLYIFEIFGEMYLCIGDIRNGANCIKSNCFKVNVFDVMILKVLIYEVTTCIRGTGIWGNCIYKCIGKIVFKVAYLLVIVLDIIEFDAPVIVGTLFETF